ncbi:MAG: hypothetical protein OJF49_000260 [Ktedonobacterales bacterium]|jgi:phospholipase/carboxylesterase|nr:MAG: hypothetical protein OJF49_000260 [Ktedonobacterales bacterium]
MAELHADLALAHLTRAPLTETADGAMPPLLALLHGVGSNERDLFRLAPELDARWRIVSPRGPLVRGPESFAWFSFQPLPGGTVIAAEELAASRNRLSAFLGEAVEAYNCDDERVYLLGFSQGAIVAVTLALTQPRQLAGVVANSGRIPPEVTPLARPAEETAGLPMLVLHGRQDAVIAVERAHDARAILERQRVALTYHEYDAGHQITAAMLADANAWLAAQLDEPLWDTRP